MLGNISFAAKPFEECVELCLRLDRECFPEEMWLDQEQLEGLITAKAEAIVVMMNGEEIGLAIILSETKALSMLADVDMHFTAHPDGAYSYSEAILPQYQQAGLGRALLREIKRLIHTQGYQRLSAHVRTKFGWDKGRAATLQMSEQRIVPGFWDDPTEVVRFQSARV